MMQKKIMASFWLFCHKLIQAPAYGGVSTYRDLVKGRIPVGNNKQQPKIAQIFKDQFLLIFSCCQRCFSLFLSCLVLPSISTVLVF
jgi:hypothetical protein